MTRVLMVMVLASLTAACATQQENAALECGAVGVGVGFLGCKLLGGSDASCAALAGVAGVGGGVLCANLSANLDKHRKELAGHENNLDARLSYMKAINADSARYNDELAKQIAAVTDHANQVALQVRQKSIDQKNLDKERANLDALVKSTKQTLDAQRESLEYTRSLQEKYTLQNQQLAQTMAMQQELYAQARHNADAVAALRQSI